MIENINDYISLVAIIVAIIMILIGMANFLNLGKIKKNLDQEMNYYKYDEKK